ncbi:MAG TPA: hypothetical protein DCX54_01905 [Flavobacteriales bacterium]|nr:hypothetical protein [Flavobacteriales bacterium]
MNQTLKLTEMKEKENDDCMLNTSEFTLLTLTPFVAAVMFIAWPVTVFVFCTVMIIGSCATLLRRWKIIH